MGSGFEPLAPHLRNVTDEAGRRVADSAMGRGRMWTGKVSDARRGREPAGHLGGLGTAGSPFTFLKRRDFFPGSALTQAGLTGNAARTGAGIPPAGHQGGGEGQVPGRACAAAVTGAGMRARSYHASPGKITSVGNCLQDL